MNAVLTNVNTTTDPLLNIAETTTLQAVMERITLILATSTVLHTVYLNT